MKEQKKNLRNNEATLYRTATLDPYTTHTFAGQINASASYEKKSSIWDLEVK